MTLLYIHGFASSSQGLKANHLRSLDNIKVFTPDLPVSPLKAISFLIQIIKDEFSDDLYLIGSSLGGFYAYYLSYKLGIKSILINPSMFPVETTQHYIGVHDRWGKNEKFHWTKDHVNELQILSDELTLGLKGMGKDLIKVYLAIHDEVLNVDKIKNFFNDYPLYMVDTDHRYGLEEFKKLLNTEFGI